MNSVTKAKRGYVPEDERNFSPSAMKVLRTASGHVEYLINEGYDLKQAVTFVGNHFLLSERQRLSVMRSVATREQLNDRENKSVPVTELAGRDIWIDGFNTIITLEVLESDSILFECMDGTIRDLAALRGTYRIIPETRLAVDTLFSLLENLQVNKVSILLDEPVSNSGRLKTLMAEAGEARSFNLDVQVQKDVDRTLYEKKNVVTSDSIILDRCCSWVNMTAEIMEQKGKYGLRVWEKKIQAKVGKSMLNETISVGTLKLKNRLVMPPMATGKSAGGIVTDDLLEYYRERAVKNGFGLIITEHSCITEAGRASKDQLSISADEQIPGLKRITDVIHESGTAVIAQLNHAGSAAMPFTKRDNVSASAVNIPAKKLLRRPRALSIEEIHEIEGLFVSAALRALAAGYDGVEIHSAHGYLLDQFYSPLTNRREDEYGPQTMENRTRFLVETVKNVRKAIGPDVPIAVRLGGADYLPGGATEEDAVEASRLIETAGADLLDISGGMCFYSRPGHSEAGYFGSMTEKIKKAVRIPVLLTGGVSTVLEAERLLKAEKADLIGIGRAVFKNADWRQRQ